MLFIRTFVHLGFALLLVCFGMGESFSVSEVPTHAETEEVSAVFRVALRNPALKIRRVVEHSVSYSKTPSTFAPRQARSGRFADELRLHVSHTGLGFPLRA